jgi:hypothetical protein
MNERHQYTVGDLRRDIQLRELSRLYVEGHLGRTEVPLDLLEDIINDGFSAQRIEPIWISPYTLKILQPHVGVLIPNPRSRRSKNGLLGRVHLTRIRAALSPGHIGGTSSTRARYRDWQPGSDAPLMERIQTRRSRGLAKKERKAL